MKKLVYSIFLLLAASAFVPQHAGAAFSLTYEDKSFEVAGDIADSWQRPVTISGKSAITMTGFDQSYYVNSFVGKTTPEPVQTFSYNPKAVYEFVKTISSNINQAAQEPQLVIENNKATKFTPPQDGRVVDTYATVMATLTGMSQNATSVPVSVSTTKPTKSLADTNNLGIRELIGHGVSSFKGSPKNRIHNIQVGVEKVSGIVVAPGQEFSFNDNLGPVEAETGFLPELVIKADKGTIPEFGGGLCQVSSTTFRAAMDAGLPITQRRNHSYAVQYYAPQGTDATIYPGVIDLKFLNDTPGNILVWPHFEGKDGLVYDIYGTKDGRKVQLDKPVVYDRKTDGSMKATWTRVVTTASGEEKTDVFKSNYLPPALFHKTESFASASSTPTPPPTGGPITQTN